MGTPAFEIKALLSPERQREIILKLAGAGFLLEDGGQFFIARLEVDGKKVARHFPKWETVNLEQGGVVKITDSIEIFFRFGPEISIVEGMERLREYKEKRKDRR